MTMTLEGVGRIYEHVRGRMFVYLPAEIHRDSAFPFKTGEMVRVRIDGKRLIVEKAK